MNNNQIQQEANRLVKNHIRRNLSPEAIKAVQVTASIFDGLMPLFHMVNNEIQAMVLDEEEMIKGIPAGVWEMWSKQKKKYFLLQIGLQAAIVNRSQAKMKNLILEQMQVLDELSEGTREKLLEIQEQIFKAANIYENR